MKLVLAKKSDADQCMNMIKDFYQIDNYPFSKAKAMDCFEQIISNDQLGRFWLIQNENEKVVGYLILCFGFSFEYGGKDAFIDEIYLIPEARSKGIGTEVLKQLGEEARLLDIKAVHLEVEKTNKAGNKLYTSTGFKSNNRLLLTQLLH